VTIATKDACAGWPSWVMSHTEQVRARETAGVAGERDEEARFRADMEANLTRNYLSQLAHGMLAMTGFRLVNAPTFVPAYLFLLSGSASTVGLVLAMQHLGAFFSSVFGATAIEHRKRIVELGLRYGWMMRLSVLGLARSTCLRSSWDCLASSPACRTCCGTCC
jgi:hypothetical protein